MVLFWVLTRCIWVLTRCSKKLAVPKQVLQTGLPSIPL